MSFAILDAINRRRFLARVAGSAALLSVRDVSGAAAEHGASAVQSRRIVNIYNFVRNSDPRLANSEDVLYEATAHQLALLQHLNLPGTFALQYDALINPRYQQLFKAHAAKEVEIGAWLEIPRALVQQAGIPWRGPATWKWDWHVAVDFTVGYSPDDRKKLADVFMTKFKSIFGKFPATVGAWYLDEITLSHLAENYGVVASCNCKDQAATDGYTLWGGYWSQAYYPSRLNAYMPAQNRRAQINIPVFRMLGSDPIYQYQEGLGGDGQGVITLETVYSPGGRSRKWVQWVSRCYSPGTVPGFCLCPGRAGKFIRLAGNEARHRTAVSDNRASRGHRRIAGGNLGAVRPLVQAVVCCNAGHVRHSFSRLEASGPSNRMV